MRISREGNAIQRSKELYIVYDLGISLCVLLYIRVYTRTERRRGKRDDRFKKIES